MVSAPGTSLSFVPFALNGSHSSANPLVQVREDVGDTVFEVPHPSSERPVNVHHNLSHQRPLLPPPRFLPRVSFNFNLSQLAGFAGFRWIRKTWIRKTLDDIGRNGLLSPKAKGKRIGEFGRIGVSIFNPSLRTNHEIAMPCPPTKAQKRHHQPPSTGPRLHAATRLGTENCRMRTGN